MKGSGELAGGGEENSRRREHNNMCSDRRGHKKLGYFPGIESSHWVRSAEFGWRAGKIKSEKYGRVIKCLTSKFKVS